MAAAPAIPVNPSLTQRLAMLDQGQRLRMIVGVVLLVAVGVVGLMMGRQAEWRVLFANLSDKDGGAIIAQLSQMNVPYKHADGGGAILVPADKVHDTRLRLASQGLPKGSVAGFELMEANRFGMTQFQERLTFQRGLEGELTRSIQALSSVQSARVHLALPNQNGFFREQQKPSASILLSLAPGRGLDRTQLAGIVHLVASSVPEMRPSDVSVLDDTGKLLSTPSDGSAGAMGGDAQQLQYVQQIEQMYSRRILDLLEPVVGAQNVKAQVTVDVDFSQIEQTSETHRPNQNPDAATVRSKQTIESTSNAGNETIGGIPGASTNQPPSPSTAPINGAAPAGAGSAAASAANGNAKREAIINYEVDKTIKVVRGGSGVVKRVNAAVVLNHQTLTDAKGKTTTTPLSEQQLQKMTELVREAVGFSQERGDSVNLMNAPFAKEKLDMPEIPLWRQPEVREVARSLAWPVGTLLFAALVLLGVLKPAFQSMSTSTASSAPRHQLDAVEAEEPERPRLTASSMTDAAPEITASEKALEDARKLTRDNPAAVASIVKTWINGD